jgi:hypothetical protein
VGHLAVVESRHQLRIPENVTRRKITKGCGESLLVSAHNPDVGSVQMRKIGLLFAVSVLFSPIASMTEPPATLYVVEPGDVSLENSQLISGSVTLKSSPSGSTSKTGGGCLIYVSVPQAKSCTSDSECRAGGGTGYCASFDRSPGQQGRKACWTQPAASSCHKSPVAALPLDKKVPFDNGTNPYPSGVQKPIRWRVVSCQNLVAGGCGKPNSTDQDRVYRYGEIKQFP